MIERIAAIVSAAICAGLIITFVPPLLTPETAFATVRAAPTDDSAVSQPRLQRSCDDFESWFLNPACSKARAKHTARTKHRVATFATDRLASARFASAKR
jgi:hypothetical protein